MYFCKIKDLALLLVCMFYLSPNYCLSQAPSIGLLHKVDDVAQGYTLFSPEGTNKSYFINNCGEKINEWTFTESPGLTAYFLENGNILRAGRDSLEIGIII